MYKGDDNENKLPVIIDDPNAMDIDDEHLGKIKYIYIKNIIGLRKKSEALITQMMTWS